MIYYPLTTLMLAGIREILVISTPQDTPRFHAAAAATAASGESTSQYAVQPSAGRPGAGVHHRRGVHRRRPSGAWSSATTFSTAMRLSELLQRARARADGRHRVRLPVHDPERYGVVEFDSQGEAISLEEKPQQPQVALRGDRPVFLRPARASKSPPRLKPSARGELEITDVNRAYLRARRAGRRSAWAAASPGSIPARTNR